ncbi:hypothetical protein OEA41_003466 [Lepraria neglecta]|uniref:Uncharacterized protein n=1 Tax=Lepraria neglecta TaxID=209136 RepID=A0AAD9Z7T4_9LECA|nr:hypothetical protein OEA41_003466 [Lepraria neglecta]
MTLPDKHFYLYLDGWAPKITTLSDATLYFSVKCGDDPEYYRGFGPEQIKEFPNIVIRTGFNDYKYEAEYVWQMRPGRIQIIADGMFHSELIKTGTFSFRARTW